jgi:hypothetical protein
MTGVRMDSIKSWHMLKPINLDDLFHSVVEPIVLNNIQYSDKDYADTLNNNVYSKTGEISFVVSCECGYISGNYYKEVVCPRCGQQVKSDFASNNRLINKVWLTIPDDVPGVLHPVVYSILDKWLKSDKKGYNYIDIILNPKLEMSDEIAFHIKGRGHKFLYENFFAIMEYFMTVNSNKKKIKSVPYIANFLQEYRDLIFCKHLPVLSSVLHVMTTDANKSARRYGDPSAKHILNAAINLSHLQYSTDKYRTSDDYETSLHAIYKSYMTYNDSIKAKLDGKPALLRKHLFGARFHWSARTVVVPIVEFQRYDEIHLSWKLAVNLLKIHIIGRLIQQHGMNFDEAIATQAKAQVRYDLFVHNILKDLINETPGSRGLPLLINRNPKSFD